MTKPHRFRVMSLPLGAQLIGIVVCTLLTAQFVTLALTMLLPPSPAKRWTIDEVATGLSSATASDRLERSVLDGPPDVSGEGWFVAPGTRAQLAQRLGQADNDVILAFYTQLPVGGMTMPVDRRRPGPAASTSTALGDLLMGTAHAQAARGGPAPGGGGIPGGGMPRAGFPGGGFPGGGNPGGRGPGTAQGPTGPGGSDGSAGGRQHSGSGSDMIRGAEGADPGGRNRAAAFTAPRAPNAIAAAPAGLPAAAPASALAAAPLPTIAIPTPAVHADARSEAQRPQTIDGDTPPPAPGDATGLASSGVASTAVAPPSGQPISARPVPFRRAAEGLLGLATPPFIEGDFVGAVRRPDGRWIVVAPKAEGFPNRWQRQVALWFALSLAVISPLAWLFARRIVRPLERFARAAEVLGRDPAATIMPLSGPAEIGRAANAFNQMRARLRAFVDDRTAVVGAISHDLRTPLTRLRFRIENVPDQQRDGLLREVAEMEDMITQVIAYIRDAATPGPRETRDLRDLAGQVIADARLVGNDVILAGGDALPVVVDPVGIRRLLANLIENAVKYGTRAQVRLRVEQGEAIAEILDAGPGIPREDRERVFEPFYRSDAARRSGKPGTGLGLAVCRSIARAHGGEVCFVESPDGFVTRLSMPLQYDDKIPLAA